MNFFIISYFVGVALVFIPSIQNFILVLQDVFGFGELEIWQSALLLGSMSSLVFFASKHLIEKNGPLKFWVLASVLTLFLTLLILFVSTSAAPLY